MNFFNLNRHRVEEDLERIRKANLSEEQRKQEEENLRKAKETLSEVGFMDVIAMIIAAFSVILPYALVFIIFMILFSLGIQAIF